MKKFARISEFEQLTENDTKKLFGGVLDAGTTKTVSCTVVTATAGGTCNNGISDNSVDSGQGSECIKDPIQ